jgi:hypothetical protein
MQFERNMSSRTFHLPARVFILAWILLLTAPGNRHALAEGTAPPDSLFYFKGRVLDSLTRNPVPFTHVINTGRITATICDTLGYFFIRVRRGDTLQLTSIGYAPARLVVTDSLRRLEILPDLFLHPVTYSIRGVMINPLGSYATFRDKVARLELPPSRYEINPGVYSDLEQGIDTLDMMPVPTLSPVTALYNWLSKEGKSRRKLRELIEQEEFERQIAYKYSPLIVSGITGYSGFTLYRFMDFCSFSHQFLQESDRYVIRDAVVARQKEFEAIESDNQ